MEHQNVHLAGHELFGDPIGLAKHKTLLDPLRDSPDRKISITSTFISTTAASMFRALGRSYLCRIARAVAFRKLRCRCHPRPYGLYRRGVELFDGGRHARDEGTPDTGTLRA